MFKSNENTIYYKFFSKEDIFAANKVSGKR